MRFFLRFAVTSLGVAVLIFVVAAFKAPSGFDWRHVSATTWLTGGGVAMGCGFVLALIELIYNLFAPKRGKLGSRRSFSIWDYIIP